MKIFQSLPIYSPYIPYFEKRYINNLHDMSFYEMRNLLINDGYSNTYILKPVFEAKFEEMFYTLWDYEALQFKWAQENGLKSRDLDEIRLAQIEEFKPDIFYSFSPNRDNKIIQSIKHKKEIIKICWDAIATQKLPSFYEDYDLRLTLFEPFIKFWTSHGYKASFLPAAFSPLWDNLSQNIKDIDVLFYGQCMNHIFINRINILKELVPWTKKRGLKFKLHLQDSTIKKPLINVRGVRYFTRWIPSIPKIITDNSLPPIYGQQLYETISRSKIVINLFGDYNGLYRDNMRDYESIGCGAVLIGEDGIYPDHFIPGEDLFTFKSFPELFDRIDHVLSSQDQGLSFARRAKEKLKSIYSKEYQWQFFINAVNSL